MATALANRLRRLEAIREAANRLMNRPQFQRDIFPRGQSGNRLRKSATPKFTATLFDLLNRLCRAASTTCAGHRAFDQANGVVAIGKRARRWNGIIGIADDLELPRRISPELRRRSLAESHRICLELCRSA